MHPENMCSQRVLSFPKSDQHEEKKTLTNSMKTLVMTKFNTCSMSNGHKYKVLRSVRRHL